MALVIILAVLVMFALYAALSSLSDASVRVKRDQVTRDALIRAKEALIAYAVADNQRPGELPCPDIDNDGRSLPGVEYVGANCASYTGRLPWITLGLPDLRDDAGERLWYALSTEFRSGLGGTTPLNNDTAYRPGNTSLNIAGTQPAANLVAIVFSPGTALPRSDGWVQSRACTPGTCDAEERCTTTPPTVAARCDPRNYLDRSGVVDNADPDVNFASAAAGASFNDRLLPIASDDIMSIVQRRAGRELAQKLRDQFALWQGAATVSAASRKGFYPYAAPLTAGIDPSVAQPGSNGTLEGLLPMSSAPVVWESASITGILPNCLGVGTPTITCTAFVLLGVGGNVTGRVRNIATGFVEPPNGTEMTPGGLVLLGAPSASPWTLVSGSNALDFSSGISFLGTGIVTVTVRAPNVVSAWVTDPNYWVTANNWYQNAYYALSQGYALAGGAACGAGPLPSCLSVGNVPPGDKRALVLMTGRALAGQRARPPANTSGFAVGDYLEAGNQTTGDFAFARDIRTAAFNDEPIVVMP